MWWFWVQPWVGALVALLGAAPQAPPRAIPANEMLAYRVEWRLIHAGNARLSWASSKVEGDPGFASELSLESVGLVSRLYKVNNRYSSVLDDRLCVESSALRASEGSRRTETTVKFDRQARKARVLQRDLVKNLTATNEIDIRACEHDVIGALYELRRLQLDAGQTVQIPVSDGKKAVMAKVEAQERETVKTDFGTYRTIRYEAFLFNNVLYRRSGRLFVWLTDDARRLPVQIRVRMPFYIGTVTLQLEKENKS